MTRTVIATFVDPEAARRAANALGRAELAAGPTRVQVAAAGTDHAARLELRVEEPDASRAIALMREHGADVVDRDEDGADLRGRGPLAAWGMAVADAVTAAMGGATASDAQVPADGVAGDRASSTRGGAGALDDGVSRGSGAGSAGASPRSVDATMAPSRGSVDAPAGSSQGSIAAPGAPSRGTITDDQREAVERDLERQDRAANEPPRKLGIKEENSDLDDPDTLSIHALPGLRKGMATRKHTDPGDEAPAGRGPAIDDSAALNSSGSPRDMPRDARTPPMDASGNPLIEGTEAVMQAKVSGGAPQESADDKPSAASGPVIWGNAPTPRTQAGTASGTHLSDTVAAGTQSSMGQIGPGSSLSAAMGATEGDPANTASGTRTKADPDTLARADDVPPRDPRPKKRRPASDA